MFFFVCFGGLDPHQGIQQGAPSTERRVGTQNLWLYLNDANEETES